MSDETTKNDTPAETPTPTPMEQAIATAKANVAKLMDEKAAERAEEEVEDTAGDEPAEMPAAEFSAAVDRAKALGFTDQEAAGLIETGLLAKIELALSAKQPAAAPEPAATEPEPDTAEGNGDVGSDEIAALKAQIRALEARIERVPDAIDDLAIRSGHEAIFGRERWIDPGSKEQANRQRLRTSVEVLRAGYAAKGQAIPPDAELVERAVRMEFSDELAASRAAPVRARQAQMISRPAPRQERELPHGKERAYATMREKEREINARNS